MVCYTMVMDSFCIIKVISFSKLFPFKVNSVMYKD